MSERRRHPLARRKRPSLIRRLIERDGLRCRICGHPIPLDAPRNAAWALSIDHVVPRASGGSHAISNLALAHRWCNSVSHPGDAGTIELRSGELVALAHVIADRLDRGRRSGSPIEWIRA